MACRSVLKALVPKEMKEALARENARLLMQAQSDLGLLAGQIAAVETGTRPQIEMFQRGQENNHMETRRSARRVSDQVQLHRSYPQPKAGQAYQPRHQPRADCVISQRLFIIKFRFSNLIGHPNCILIIADLMLMGGNGSAA
jgi:hypothetical protein